MNAIYAFMHWVVKVRLNKRLPNECHLCGHAWVISRRFNERMPNECHLCIHAWVMSRRLNEHTINEWSQFIIWLISSCDL
jgi:hypothetical protein